MSFDPGAERQGFAVLEGNSKEAKKSKPPVYHGSGVLGVARTTNKSKEPYQRYRLRVIEFWVVEAPSLIRSYEPDVIVSEIVPVVGGGNFVAATQSQLAATAITAVQAVACELSIPIVQIGATTMKKCIGGKGNATKVAVRNGVIKLIPFLAERKKQWTKIFEEPDALGLGLTHLGYKV